MIPSTIGIDISKDHLDIHRLADGQTARFANDQKGHAALLKWLRTAPVARIVYEPTGPYHRALEQALAAAGLPLVKVNPQRARRFAEITGKLAKTDRCDAALLARMGEALGLEAQPHHGKALSELKELLVARQALVRDRTAAKNREKTLTIPLLRRQNAARLRDIERALHAIDAAMEDLIAAEPGLHRRREILASIPGLSTLTASTLLIEMPELGALDGKQAASLAGLAPITRQSGHWLGHAFIRGGRANLRRALYMPALVASRFNPDLKRKYQQLLALGKPPKVAITAVMRKLIVLANALLRVNRTWSPSLA